MCGLAGIITKEPKAFDYSTFCTLGIANDSRGGDSCGIFIDGRYEYGIKEHKFFSSYFMDSNILEETTKSMVALVHCRKASIGKIDETTAQPVVMTDNNGNVLYVLMHNGTIYNYKELAATYIPGVNISGMTDSQVMANIFFNSGYKALDEYNGSAVFVIVDYRGRSPKTLLFKGASKKTKYSKEEVEERPLYYCIDKYRRELVFSSIASYLIALRRNCDIYSLRSNTLVEFDGDSLVTSEIYNRNNCTHSNEIVQSYTPVYSWRSIYDEDDVADFNFAYSSNYISIDFTTNICQYNGKKMHGKFYVSDYGKVNPSSKKGAYEVYFYNGVALKNSHCFKFLANLQKNSGLSNTEFENKFRNMIRFLSVDGIYSKDGIWYKAISPKEYVLYSGKYTPFSATTEVRFNNGIKISTSYSGVAYPLKEVLSNKNTINFKEIMKQCMS